ncbi:kinase-like protein [Phanerochaete sordida]|uniref:Kinase-like protein n=1 Tax=Phanerochaete sordida TaxID=48140 RepID=A0A9P3G5C5_9APHY|nr:kinase-like protein [Phanerochaete sordida]
MPAPLPTQRIILRDQAAHAASRYMQRFMLAFILLLPGVEPVLEAFIREYLHLPREATEPVSARQTQPSPPHAAQTSRTTECDPETPRADIPRQVRIAPPPVPRAAWTPPTPYKPPRPLPPCPVPGGQSARPSPKSRRPLPVPPAVLTIEGPPPVENPRYPTPPTTKPADTGAPPSLPYDPSSTAPALRLLPPSPEVSTADLSEARQSVAADDGDDREDLDEAADWEVPPVLTHAGQAYCIMGTLGEGGSGRVIAARTRTGHTVAVKVVHKAKAYRNPFGRENLKDEKFNWERVTHERRSFLVHLLMSFDDPENVYFVMPLYHMNLLQRITRDEPISSKDLKLYTAELIAAVHNLHSSGVIHRDIKPENVLISPTGHLALADFGLAYTNWDDMRPFSRLVLADCVGTPGYFAPEVLVADGAHGYGWQADVWGAGVVALELHLRATRPLFAVRDTAENVRCMLTRDVPLDDVRDPVLRALLARMLARDPRRRASAAELMQDPYFAGVDWEKLQRLGYKPDYVPPRPSFDRTRQCICFSSFHRGDCVHDSYSVHFDSHGRVQANRAVLRQLSEDRHDRRGDFYFERPYGVLPSARHDGYCVP